VIVASLAVGLAVWLLVPPPLCPDDPEGGHRHLPVVALMVCAGLLLIVPRGWLAPMLVVSAAGVGAAVLRRRHVAARRAHANAGLLAEMCDLVASELAAGRPVEAALAEAADAWPEIRPVAEASRLGGDVPEALRQAASLPGAEGLRLLAAAWFVAQRTGGGLTAATRRVADSVRRDQATRRVVAGELASARATARLVAALPVVALLMGSGAGADPWSFLLRTPWGLACLACGLAVGFAGLWWIELIARGVDR
jgi:tight adherence protein B